MALRFNKSKLMRRLVLVGAGIGLIHFGLSLVLWGCWAIIYFLMARRGDEIYYYMFIDAVPAVILFAGSLIALVMAWKRKRGAGLVLVWTVLASVVFFIHDATNNRWQVQMMIRNKGCEFSYYNWPWYDRAIGKSRFAVIDKIGNFVAESEFPQRRDFSEGLAATRINDNYGYVNQAGDIVIQPQFDYAGRFSEALAVMRIDGKYGYIDTTGQVVIEPQFKWAECFSEGLARVQVEDKCGYIDKRGRIVIEAQFDSAYPFAQGVAFVEVDDKWGLIDQTGQMLVRPQFRWSSDFCEGLAKVELDDKSGYIDKTGGFAIEPKFDSAGDFSEGLARAKLGEKHGFIDKTGQFVDGLYFVHFDMARNFREGLAPAKVGKRWGYIDKTGRVVIRPKFDFADNFSEGLARVMKWYGGKFGYINKTGEFAIKPTFDGAEDFENGVARVRIAKAISRSTTYGIVIGLAAGLLLLNRQARRRTEMKALARSRETSNTVDDWHLYKGLSLEHKGYKDWIAELAAGKISADQFKRRTENQREYLLELIDKLLGGQISFKDFAEAYCPFVLNLVPDFISERDQEFFDMVCEKLEWVSESSIARQGNDMVITPQEFIEWLREEKAKHFEAG